MKMAHTLIVLAWLLCAAWAQSELPVVRLSSFALSTDEALRVSAEGLEPDADYVLRLTGPGETQEAVVRASSIGTLQQTLRLPLPGSWQLGLAGPRLDDLSFRLRSSAADSSAAEGSALPSPPEAQDPAPEDPAPEDPKMLAEAQDAPPFGDEADAVPGQAPSDQASDQASDQPSDQAGGQAEPELLPDGPLPEEVPSSEAPLDDSQSDEPSSDEVAPPSPDEGVQDGVMTQPRPSELPQVAPDQPLEAAVEDSLEPSQQPAGPNDELEDEPVDAEAVPLDAAGGPDGVTVDGDAVVSRAGGRVDWRLEFPQGSGETSALLSVGDTVYVGHGNSVLALEPEVGAVRARWLVPGQVTALEEAGDELLISTRAGGLNETFTLRGDELLEPVRFDPDAAALGWLRAEAQGPDPAARLEQDATNPWLHLAVGQNQGGAAARRHYQNALDAAQTFYDHAGLAQELAALGEYDLADAAMRASLTDFAARGYDPRLLSLEAHERYNFPLRAFEAARGRGDAQAAAFWAGWLRYFAVPEAPEVRSALLSYADGLRAAGDRDGAQAVLATLPPPRDTATVGTLENAALSIGRSGWLIALALLLAYLALHMVLAAKYQQAQQINLERRRLLNRPVRPLSWLMLIRYYSFTEKLILVLLLLGAALASALAAWFERSAPDSALLGALRSGSLSGSLARNIQDDPALLGERGAFVKGYAAQVAGDDAAAAEFYAQAGRYPPAVNNLGVLERSQARFQEALRLSPEVPEARYNLGETPDEFSFQRDFLPGEPVLAVPMVRDVQIARAGNWDQAVSGLFVAPWGGLTESRPSGMAPWLWTLLLVLGLLLVLVTVLWLFVPRMTWIRKAPRPWYYQVLALLVPGSGLADEMWGLLLIVPWAVAGTDALAEAFRWELGIGTGLTLFWNLVVLVVVYLVNLIAVVIEYLSYRRRMRDLARDNPALAEEFGVIARAPRDDVADYRVP